MQSEIILCRKVPGITVLQYILPVGEAVCHSLDSHPLRYLRVGKLRFIHGRDSLLQGNIRKLAVLTAVGVDDIVSRGELGLLREESLGRTCGLGSDAFPGHRK